MSFAGKTKWWQIVLIVIAAILFIIGIVLWVVVGVVVSNPLDGSKLFAFACQCRHSDNVYSLTCIQVLTLKWVGFAGS